MVEGVLSIRQQFGPDVKAVYLAVGAYESGDNGALDLQTPKPVRSNKSIEADEFIQFELAP